MMMMMNDDLCSMSLKVCQDINSKLIDMKVVNIQFEFY